MVPRKKCCFKCVTVAQYGAKPKNADWDEFEPLLALSPKCKEQLATWRKRLESGGVHYATFALESVQVETDVSLSWEEEMDINIVEGGGLVALQAARGVQRMMFPGARSTMSFCQCHLVSLRPAARLYGKAKRHTNSYSTICDQKRWCARSKARRHGQHTGGVALVAAR